MLDNNFLFQDTTKAYQYCHLVQDCKVITGDLFYDYVTSYRLTLP